MKSTIYVAQTKDGFLKITNNRDRLPTDAHTIEGFRDVTVLSIDLGKPLMNEAYGLYEVFLP